MNEEIAKDGSLQKSERAIAALFIESLFNISTPPGEDVIMDEYECSAFGKDSQEDIDKKLDCRVEAGIAEGSSRVYADKRIV